ncbi:MAG: hypothetical protein JXA28_12435 [Bacteroidetes bacterium]|nr:hypothetical protein [Bacteroidota bacterium]
MKTFLAFAILLIAVTLFPACSEDDPVTPQEEHFEAIGVVLTTSGIRVASILRGETGDTLKVSVGQLSDHFEVSFYNEDEQVVEAPDDPDKTFSCEIADPTVLAVHQDDGHDGEFEFHLRGLKPGITTIELFIMHAGHADFRSGEIPVLVR